jgi:2-polyprenyl-3-methyl-5-hydroxy-6-metoxy-1,4-benzoquinol methylase
MPEIFLTIKTARKELRRYKRRGPDKPTRLLIESIKNEAAGNKSLLDIGGGIGAIQLELFKYGLGKSINVDASQAYQAVSKAEAENRRLANKTEYYFGDYTDLADGLPQSHIVTLDKVICCYPDADKLLDESLKKATEIYGLVFPRETILARIVFRLGNVWFKIRKSEFRTYLHPASKVESLIESHGFVKRSYNRTFFWHVITFKREPIA